jgi:hypothetical protein
MKYMKPMRIALLSIFAAIATMQTGCSDREVAAGAAGAVIGAIIVDSAHRSPPPPPPRPVHRCEIRQREHCGYYPIYGGGSVYKCVYQTVDTCGGRYRKMGGNSAESLEIAELSQMYKLQPESASKLIVALNHAQNAQDDASAAAAWAQIGVDLQEAKSLGTSGSLSAEAIDRIARALDQDVSATTVMVNGILATARQLQAAKTQINSAN